MATSINVDMTDVREFYEKLERDATSEFKAELDVFLDALGNELLRIVQDEIVRLRVMDTRQLLASFHKGSEGNVWHLQDGGLVLDVGSSVSYAGFVNDGHWTNPRGVAVRFVPGHWEGHRFIYDPGASGGMVLRQKWVPGKHYFDSALRILDSMLPALCESSMRSWIARYS